MQEGSWPDSNVPFGALRLWDAGTNWSQVESIRGVYDWRALDTALKTAERKGVDDGLLVLGSTPTWNASRIKPGDYPVPGAASAPRASRHGMHSSQPSSSATRAGSSLPDLERGEPGDVPERLAGESAEMTKRAADIIHAKDPKALVVAASTTVRLDAAFNRFFPRYLTALAQLGWPVDAFAAHLYPASLQTPDERAAFITQVTDQLAAAGAPDLPLWDTDLNYGLAGPGPNPRQTIAGAERARDGSAAPHPTP